MLLNAQPDLQRSSRRRVTGPRRSERRSRRTSISPSSISHAAPDRVAATREPNRRRLDIRILILSMNENERYLYEALEGRRRRPRPGQSLPRHDARRAVPRFACHEPSGGGDPLRLSEAEVVKLSCRGPHWPRDRRAARDQRQDSRAPRGNILGKLAMRERVDLTRDAVRHGLVEP
jgi:hypothetical protein